VLADDGAHPGNLAQGRRGRRARASGWTLWQGARVPAAAFRRYVALGDSTTEGLEDPYPDGSGYRGFADLLAARLAALDPEVRYANLAIRGRKLPQIRAEQLEPALELGPDLVTIVGGVNDVLRPKADVAALAEDLDAMTRALRAAGATVLLMTYPQFGEVMAVARAVGGRLTAFNAAIHATAARHGALVIDLAASGPMDVRLFHADRLHANALGHERIAEATAWTLGLPGAGEGWREPLPPTATLPRRAQLAGDLRWAREHLVPWVGRRVRGVSSGDGRRPKRPQLAPVEFPAG
jgi:lysophospholipase L1-like esterase